MSGRKRLLKVSPQVPKPQSKPTKKVLVEELCLSKLLENCIKQVEIALSPKLDRVSDIEDVTLLRAIQKHQLLCDRLERVDGPGAQGGDDAQIKSQIKNSYRDVMRIIRDNPDAAVHLRPGLDTNIGENETLFVENLKSIFRCTPEQNLDEDLVLKSKGATLDEKIAINTKVICDLDAKIVSQKAHISEFKRISKNQLMSEEPLTDEECQSFINTPKHASLQEKLDQLTSQRMKLFLDNREKERDIQEETENVENVIEYNIEQFDEHMEAMQADLEAREEELRRLEEELKKLETMFTDLEVEYDQVAARRQEAEDRTREEQRVLKLKTRAAIIVQAWWRGYRVRKALKNKTKKNESKGKSKGKKK